MAERLSGGAIPAGIWPPKALLGEEILEATLGLVISLVLCTVERSDGVSVSLLTRAHSDFHTPSASSPEFWAVDAVQYETDGGPCVEAARTGEPVNVRIESARGRWPEFCRQAAVRGVGSVLSVPLRDGDGVIGALNIYSRREQAFADEDQHAVGHFAHYVAVVLRTVSEFMTTDWISQQVAEALSRADVIGQAKGILMAKGYSPDDALASLRRASERTNRKLSDVAQDMVSSSRRGLLPPRNE